MNERGQEPTGRLPVEERAARRVRVERAGGDRYRALLHTLRAGRELALEEPRRVRLEWHPIVWPLVRLVLVVAAVWILATISFRLWRENHVDVWSGPDSSVTSGQRLAGCRIVNVEYDDVYPTWVRFGGAIYRGTGLSRPFGSNSDGAYAFSGYRLGELELFRITNTPDGRAGKSVLLKFASTDVGDLFLLTPECS